ncbi:unnamed protein product, partial [Medioppia subpectinata]
MHVIILTLLFSIYLVSGELYHEDYRPQLRYTPPKGWNNDPNGLLHYKDKYHLFFQYFPDAPHNGPQHWGHAVSTDLFHWENLPIALYPQLDGHEMIWSGSAIVDERNVTGFQPVGSANKTMVAIFTGMHDTDGTQSQWFAYSLDEGLNWKYYAGNPIIPNPGLRDFRDPKIFAFGDHYVIVLAAGDHVNLYSSQDMKHWELIQDIYLVSGELYHEDYRPQLRYTPPKGWNNDPNGLLHYKDKYHLFFQYFPDAPHNGPQHWGHAVSTDLFHWENLPIALYPQLDGHEMIWSGSAIVDERNVTGFQPVGSANKTMVAI